MNIIRQSPIKFNKKILLVGLLLLIVFPTIASAASKPDWAVPTTGLGGDINNPDQAVAFYLHFRNYLTPMSGWLGIFVTIGGTILKGLCSLADLLQSIFFTSVKLMGIFSDFSDVNTPLGKLFHASQVLGTIIFTLTAVIYGLFVIFNGKSKTVKSILVSFIIVTFGFSVVPWGLNTINGLVQDSAEGYQTSTGLTSVGTSIIQQNVVDKYALNRLNWNVELDASGNVADASKYNVIKSMNEFDAGEMAGVMNHDLLTKLDKENEKGDASAEIVFEHSLSNSVHKGKKGGDQLVGVWVLEKSKYHSNIGALNMTEQNYLRYRVSWLPAIIQATATAALFLIMTLKVILSIYQIVATSIFGGVLAAIRSKSSKKAKEIFTSIFFGVAGVIFDLLIVYVAMDMMTWLQSSSAATIVSTLPVAAALLLKAIAYVGILFGSFAGVGIVEKYLGVSSGQGNAFRQIMTAAIVTRATLGAGKAVGGGAYGAGKQAGKGIKGLFMKSSDSKGSGAPKGSSQSTGTAGTSGGTTPGSGSGLENSESAGNQESNRKAEAKDNLEKGGNESTSPTESPKEDKSSESKEGSWDSGIETPSPKSSRKDKAKMNLEQQPEVSSDGEGSNGSDSSGSTSAEGSSDGLNGNVPPETAQQPKDRIDQLQETLDKMKQDQAEQAKKSGKAQKKSQRKMMASQRASQAFNNLAQSGAESHIGKQENDEE